MKKFFRKSWRLQLLIVFILIFLIASAGYFFITYRFNSRVTYVSGILLRPPTINLPIYSVPYWIANSIDIGDSEYNPLGTSNAVVEDKVVYDTGGYSQMVTLLLQMRVNKDRSGVILYKNKPLAVGSILDLKLTKSQATFYITSIGNSYPNYEYYKTTISTRVKGMDPLMADSVKVGMILTDSKKNILAKVTERTLKDAEIQTQAVTGQSIVSYDKTKKDAIFQIELVAKIVEENYYFMETQKVRVNETLYFPFNEISNLNLQVIAVSDFMKTDKPSL